MQEATYIRITCGKYINCGGYLLSPAKDTQRARVKVWHEQKPIDISVCEFEYLTVEPLEQCKFYVN